MAKVELKQPIVQEIADSIQDAASVVVVDYRGLTVAEDTELRKDLREAGVSYKVYKNTMVRFAIKDTDFAGLADVLEGPNAIAISKDDATAAARVLANFAKKAPKLELKAGVVEGKFYDAEEIQAIASRLLSPTWPAFSIRSRRRAARQLPKSLLRQQPRFLQKSPFRQQPKLPQKSPLRQQRRPLQSNCALMRAL